MADVLPGLRGTFQSLFRVIDVQLKRVSATALALRDDTDTAFINARAADAVINDDLVTLRQLTAAAAAAYPSKWGNVAFVDAVNGNNATGAINGKPFLTITAALTAAAAGNVVVYVLPGTYNETISVPANVSVVGLDRKRCILQQTGAVAPTDMVTLASGSRCVQMGILADTAAAVLLRGVVFTGGAEANARIADSRIILTHTGAGACYGIVGAGAGAATSEHTGVNNCEVLVTGSGAQARRGILVSSGSTILRVSNSTVRVARTGAAVGTYYAAEVSGANSTLATSASTYQGPTGTGGADISQTTGTILLQNSSLLTPSANSLGFSTTDGSTSYVWGEDAAVPAGATTYMTFGTGNAGTSDSQRVKLDRAGVVRSITVRAAVAPGGGRSVVYTLMVNGVATVLTATIANAATTATVDTASLALAAGDELSMRQVASAAAAATNVAVRIEVY